MADDTLQGDFIGVISGAGGGSGMIGSCARCGLMNHMSHVPTYDTASWLASLVGRSEGILSDRTALSSTCLFA